MRFLGESIDAGKKQECSGGCKRMTKEVQSTEDGEGGRGCCWSRFSNALGSLAGFCFDGGAEI